MHVVKAMRRTILRPGIHKPLLRLVSSSRRQEYRLVRLLYAEIQKSGFAAVRTSHLMRRGSIESDKYLDLWSTLEEAVHEASRLGLLRPPRLSVLDLGCGTGSFLYALRRLGHHILGLDLDVDPIYNDMVRLLSIPRIVHNIRRFEELPTAGTTFDLITAFSVCFDCHDSERAWGKAEWAFFIEDCRRRLNPGGLLYFLFNPATQRHYDFLPDAVAQMMRRIPGATLSANKERLRIQN